MYGDFLYFFLVNKRDVCYELRRNPDVYRVTFVFREPLESKPLRRDRMKTNK